MRILLCANSGAAPPQAPLVLNPSMLPIKRKHHVITMLAGRECCADDYVCKWGGLRPPPKAPAVLKPAMFAIKRKHHVINRFAIPYYGTLRPFTVILRTLEGTGYIVGRYCGRTKIRPTCYFRPTLQADPINPLVISDLHYKQTPFPP